MPTGHVFISYVREDARHADLLRQALESAGIRVWGDTAELWPGEDWRARIRHEISSNALVFLACFSRQSLAREVSYQNEELALALEQMRLRRPDYPWLIPVRFDDCQVPELGIGGGRTLATIQCVDVFGDRAGDGMQRLAAAVCRILGGDTANPALGDGWVRPAASGMAAGQRGISGSLSPRSAVPDAPAVQASRSRDGRDQMRPGRPLSEVNDPFQLEVHPAISVGASVLPALPAYVQREHDRALGAVVARAVSGASGLAVLVGGSSTGKTRACWEALRQLRKDPHGWRLWHPIDPAPPDAALVGLAQIGPRTVVWLNEAQRYLLTRNSPAGEQVAAGLRELLRTPGRGPVLVLGTLWPAYWDILTAVPQPGELDTQAQSRELLKGATIRVAEAFIGTDLDAARRAGKSGDPRLAEALARAPSGRLTQYLAGGPALIDRYDNADPSARAILDAAIDARRLGLGPVLPHQLLEDAVNGYLSDEQWDLLADDWLEHAFAYLTDPRPCRGARAPLTRYRPRHGTSHAAPRQELEYRLADYLEQYGTWERRRRLPPAELFGAAQHYAPGGGWEIFYCVICRKRPRVSFLVKLEQRNGKPALGARCPECGTGMFKIGSK